MEKESIVYEISEIPKPVENFAKVVFDETIDLGVDLIEIGLDQFLEEGIIKEIPIIGAGYTIGKTFFALKDVILTKKALVFAQKVQNGMGGGEKLKKHKEKLADNPKRLIKELEILLTYLDRHTKFIKNLILGNFYIMYYDEDIDFDWEDFEFFAEIIDDLSVFDLEELKILYEKKMFIEGETYNPVAMKRLRNCGLIDFFDGMIALHENETVGYIAKITNVGEFFWEYGMKGISIRTQILDDNIIL